MNDLDRISSLDFVPTNEDILYARVRTVGVAEHRYQLQFGSLMKTWRIIDVGGTKRQVRTESSLFFSLYFLL